MYLSTNYRGSSAPATATEVSDLPSDDIIFGQTPALKAVRERILKVAPTDIPVLITGESGTGKEVFARLVHAWSSIAARNFVQLNCAAIPASLLESELFGYEKGAFTGAVGVKRGRVELANSGTLFLDEIAELDSAAQAKLLQLLQDSRFSRVGGQEDRKVDVRFIFATNRDLADEIASGNFRQDLYYRIDVVDIHLPPLRERLEDIPALVNYFLNKYNEKHNCRTAPLSDAAIARMQEYHWPGNIRQLENLMKRYVVLGNEEAIFSDLVAREADVFKFSVPPGEKISLKDIKRQAIRQVERKVILKVVEANGWNRKRAASLLGISYRALLYKLKEVGVPSERRRKLKAALANGPVQPTVVPVKEGPAQ